MKEINIGILGYGTVGAATDKLIRQNAPQITARTGVKINVRAVADVSPKVKHPRLTRNAYDVIKDPEISVIVEAIGGINPALNYVLAAIKAGKDVVTSNKEMIALYGNKIREEAARNGVSVRFEAAVGGGIPILGPLSENLAANNITEIFGIVNGTTNYILSKMSWEGGEFKEALAEAQKKGYAEANPKKDIEGYDASYKAAILASVAFSAKIDWHKVYFEGISKITQEDICYAEEIGYVIKLLAIAKKVNGEIEVRVHPTLVPEGHALSYVTGPMNAIYVRGDAVGELMFYGQGAGGMATASAVVGDILAIANPKSSALGGQNPKVKAVKIKSISEITSQYYIRLTVPDKPGVLAGISKAFASENVSIAAVMQKETIGKNATIVIVTHEAKEGNLQKAISRIKKLPVVKEVSNVIRVGL
ncbi:MAG: homoserine dehydrogenase [Candidatus Margulisiibacteriota bacterium]